jgi:type I restriction enzyme, S subunit
MTPKLRFPEFKSDWKIKRLDSISKISAGGTPSTRILDYWGGHIKWMSSGDLNQRLIYDVDGRITELGLKNSSAKIIPENSVLIGLAGQGKTRGTVAINKVELTSNQSVAHFKNITEDYQFVYFSLFKDYERLRRLSTGDGGRGGLNLSILGAYKISFPEITEQLKISKLLVILDQKINLLTKKKEALETYKKGLMQKIFSQELRFKRKDGADYPEWNEVVYSEFLKERDDKHPQSDEFPLCSFVAHKGVVPKGDRYNREFLVNDKKGKKYKRTKKGDFIYSSNNLETGSIGLNEYGNGCISPVYSVFSIDKGCDINFIAHYLVIKANLHKMLRFRQGVMYGQWRIHETDFLKIKVAIPSNDEQKHIGEVLESMNSGLEELERLISATSKLKKGLLQQMFV